MNIRSQAALRTAGWATLIANMVLVVTGGAVRLTASGLGCPTWPRCKGDSFIPVSEMGIHGVIEFGNRMLTFGLAAIAIATFVVAWKSQRRDLIRLSIPLGLGVPLQAAIGGISVLTELNPWVVSLHLLLSLAIIALAVAFLWRVEHPDPVVRRGPITGAAWATFATMWAVLYVGTMVTGSGPHAGDKDAPRNGLNPLQISQLHADVVFLYLGLTIGLLFLILAVGRSGWGARSSLRAVTVLLAVQLSQGLIGFVQYFTGLPVVLVGLHMLGAAAISATTTWVLMTVREPAQLCASVPDAAEPAVTETALPDPASTNSV